MYMNASSEPFAQAAMPPAGADVESLFHLHYPRIARTIARIVNDPGRAEELAADVFWKFLHSPRSHEGNVAGWLHRTAIRKGLDELRRQRRREKYERLFFFFTAAPSPEQLHGASEEQRQVRSVLGSLKPRDSEILILRSEELSYQEIGEVLEVNHTSIGTLLRRAQHAFRKEYIKRYGKPIP
jgi:RNA polymerase sigma-70 factor (ECF subfamily)